MVEKLKSRRIYCKIKITEYRIEQKQINKCYMEDRESNSKEKPNLIQFILNLLSISYLNSIKFRG